MNGYEAKLYFGTTPLAGTPDTGTWTELDEVKDVTIGDEIDEVSVTTRANGGRKSTDGGLRDNSLEFDIPADAAEAGYAALHTAYKGRNAIAIAAMDGPIATIGSKGPAGNWKVLGFARNEPLGDQVTVSVTLKPFDYMADYEVVA